MDVDVDAAAMGARDGHHGETATSTSTSWGDLPTDARARVISHLAPHDMIVAAAAVGDRVAELAASIATTETLFDAEIPLLARRISKDAVALLPGETWLSCWAAVSAVFQGIVTKPGEARAGPGPNEPSPPTKRRAPTPRRCPSLWHFSLATMRASPTTAARDRRTGSPGSCPRTHIT